MEKTEKKQEETERKEREVLNDLHRATFTFPFCLSISPFPSPLSTPAPPSISKQPSTAPLGCLNGSSKRATTCLVAPLWRTMAPCSLRAIRRQGRHGKRRASAPCTGSTPPGTCRGEEREEQRKKEDGNGKTGTTNGEDGIIITMQSGGLLSTNTLSIPSKNVSNGLLWYQVLYEYQTRQDHN